MEDSAPFTCLDCGKPVDPDVAWIEVRGFSIPRSGGGQNHLTLRQPTGRFLHATCGQRRRLHDERGPDPIPSEARVEQLSLQPLDDLEPICDICRERVSECVFEGQPLCLVCADDVVERVCAVEMRPELQNLLPGVRER